MTENDILSEIERKIKKSFRSKAGESFITLPWGNDCFCFKTETNNSICITQDSCIEHTHFERNWLPPSLISQKALRSAISDIAAVGGTPLFMLVSLGTPDTSKKFIREILRGIFAVSRKFNIELAGGNISYSKLLFIDTFILGKAKKPMSREGAMPGDSVFVSGTLGDSAVCVELLRNKNNKRLKNYFLKKFSLFEPRLKLGKEIFEIATACTDLSDGLYKGLLNLSQRSNVSFYLETDKIPLSKQYKEVKKDNLIPAIFGGEDYELLFTSSKVKEVESIAKKQKIKIKNIGKVIKKEKSKIIFSDSSFIPSASPFEHFSKKR